MIYKHTLNNDGIIENNNYSKLTRYQFFNNIINDVFSDIPADKHSYVLSIFIAFILGVLTRYYVALLWSKTSNLIKNRLKKNKDDKLDAEDNNNDLKLNLKQNRKKCKNKCGR